MASSHSHPVVRNNDMKIPNLKVYNSGTNEEVNVDVEEIKSAASQISNASKWAATLQRMSVSENISSAQFISEENSSSGWFAIQAMVLWAFLCIPGNVFAGWWLYKHQQDIEDSSDNATVANQSALYFDAENTQEPHRVEPTATARYENDHFVNETNWVRVLLPFN